MDIEQTGKILGTITFILLSIGVSSEKLHSQDRLNKPKIDVVKAAQKPKIGDSFSEVRNKLSDYDIKYGVEEGLPYA